MAREVIEVPITGKVVSLTCKIGDMVQEGEVVCVIESMKMENPIVATVSGRLCEIGATVGQVVVAGKLLVAIEY